MKILSAEGVERLKMALESTMNLRIRCHLRYGKERDDVFHPKMQVGKPPHNLFVLTDKDIDKIIEIYRVIFPLHRIFKRLCETRNFAELSKETFYDDSLLAQAGAYERLHRYAEAKKCYHQALSLNPVDSTALSSLSGLLWKLAEYPAAQKYAEELFTLGTRLNDEKSISSALNLQGLLCIALGDAKKSVGHFEKACRIDKKIYGDDHPHVARDINNLGTAWQNLGDTKKALGYFEEALRIDKRIYGDDHAEVVTDLNNLGLAWQNLGDDINAVDYFEEALRIDKKIYGEEHPSVTIRLNNLGLAWKDLGDAKKAVAYYEESLRINKKFYGNAHPQVATNLNNLGRAWQALGDGKKAVGYQKEALKIVKKNYGDKHPHVAIHLNNLGSSYKALRDAKKALSYYEEALKISKNIYGEEHAEVRGLCANIKSCLEMLKNLELHQMSPISFKEVQPINFEGLLSIPQDMHKVIASNLPDITSFSRLSRVNHYFHALCAEEVAAARPLKNLTLPIKKFTIPCNSPNGTFIFTCYTGVPSKLYNPLKFQNAWLKQEREGSEVPDDVMEAIQKLAELATKNNVSFTELCVYAFSDNNDNAPNEAEDKSAAELIDIQTICQSIPRKLELLNEASSETKSEYLSIAEESSTYAAAQYSLGRIFSQGIGIRKDLSRTPQFFQKPIQKQNLDKARQFYQKAAQAGHADAQFQLSELLTDDRHLKQDYLIRAAAQGHSEARWQLAIQYDTSIEHRHAVQLFLKRIQQNSKKANLDAVMQNLQGFMHCYLNAEHDPKIYDQARELFVSATKADNAAAYYNLAQMHQHGNGVVVDHALANTFLARSAELGNLYAQKKIALEAYHKEDYTQTAIWFAKAAEQGDVDAQDWMSILFRNGMGVAKDKQKELYWLKKAALQGYVDSQSCLASFYDKEHVYDLAFEWYFEAALQDHSVSMSSLGECLEKGRGVSIDYSKAALCYKKSLQLGNTDSELCLAYLLEKGLNGQTDIPQALKYYQAHTETGFACYRLARIYEKGIGVPLDKQLAQTWYEKVFEIAHKNTNGSNYYRLGLLHQYGNGGAIKSLNRAEMCYRQALAAKYCYYADEIPLRLQELKRMNPN